MHLLKLPLYFRLVWWCGMTIGVEGALWAMLVQTLIMQKTCTKCSLKTLSATTNPIELLLDCTTMLLGSRHNITGKGIWSSSTTSIPKTMSTLLPTGKLYSGWEIQRPCPGSSLLNPSNVPRTQKSPAPAIIQRPATWTTKAEAETWKHANLVHRHSPGLAAQDSLKFTQYKVTLVKFQLNCDEHWFTLIRF